VQSGALDYFQADGLGSIVAMTDNHGTPKASYTYDSFGNNAPPSPPPPPSSVTNPFRYTARELDSETGLYYYRARYYDPSAGCFLSEDPANFTSGINLYIYALNAPVKLSDPLGLFPRGWHRDRTYDLALAVLGPECQERARKIADANAAEDFSGPLGFIRHALIENIFYFGKGWDRPGPHFPDVAILADREREAFWNCDLAAFGRYLHSLQDAWAHSGLNPFDHWARGPFPDIEAKNASTGDLAMVQTAYELQRFKKKCLRCCQIP
jgi:RHS repeat-associated protein